MCCFPSGVLHWKGHFFYFCLVRAAFALWLGFLLYKFEKEMNLA